MAEIILISGGARSGKSGYAQSLAERAGGARVYLATCPPPGTAGNDDPEMEARIGRHRSERHGRNWRTVEESVDPVRALSTIPEPVVLVDCLTLWVSNLLFTHGNALTDELLAERCRELAAACRKRAGTVVLVTGEVGCGIVPENALARRYRDLVGRCNQIMGESADRAYLVACGQTLTLKEGGKHEAS
ncbi:MAG: bifunctional adenosylcobinamide kinase/adenosylcobinamide-phosphate guanylyltransferase [Thermodesulfobacteriota bacterium]